MSEDVTVHGLSIKEQKTRVYRDDKGRPRISAVVIAEPESHDGSELSDEPGTLGVVESVNDDGTVTVRVD